jgi:APA family basic amino acid/polyamine antiporter
LLGVGSCLFLMVYLPPESWWRFIGWLVLGMAIYTSYGYTHSAIGMKIGRPKRAPLPIKLASVGLLITAVGLFTIPHDAGLGQLYRETLASGEVGHQRAVVGLLMIAVGLIITAAGSVTGASQNGEGTA